jgi:hypothetical protein
MFEAFETDGRFDICLFSESYQYIPLGTGLSKALSLLGPEGVVVIADCFRTEAYRGRAQHGPKPGGGHQLADFRKTVATLSVTLASEEDITDQVAPSIDLEQGFFNVVGHGVTRIDGELSTKKPGARWLLSRLVGVFMARKRREALMERLTARSRTSEEFKTFNRYMMLRLDRSSSD